jgi:hypothetical protein
MVVLIVSTLIAGYGRFLKPKAQAAMTEEVLI